MLKVQEYLLNKSLLQLEEEHGIETSIKESYPYKVSLNYSQLDSKNSDEMACQCRGLILARKDGEAIEKDKPLGETVRLAVPMFRFFNYGQPEAASIDWSSALIEEKLDGTLCICYYDFFKNQWCVATRRVAEADLPMEGFEQTTFRELFEEALRVSYSLTFKEFTWFMNTDVTYCFELTAPQNGLVVKYDKPDLTCLFARNNKTLSEVKYIGKIKRPKIYNLKTIEDIIKYVNEQNPSEMEGVVIKDKFNNRVKVKSIAHCALNRARDSVANSPRACLELILEEKVDDVVTFLPDHLKNNLLNMQTKVSVLFSQTNKLLQELDIENKTNKEIGLALKEIDKKSVWLGPVFPIKNKQATDLKDFLQKQKGVDGYKKSTLDHILCLI